MGLNLNGFLIKCHAPSEDSLAVIVDCSELPGSRYLDFIKELQDALSAMDELYSEKTQHRRTVRARYIKYVDSRKRVIRFNPYPSALLNKIKYIRAKTYFAINKYCVVIQRFKSGMFERNIYLLPYNYADNFIKFISQINEEIEEINKLLSSVNLNSIEKILKKYDLEMANNQRLLSKIEIELFPFELNDEIIENWSRRSPAVASAIFEYKRKLVMDAINTIKPKIDELVKRLLAKKRLKDVKKNLEELKKFAESVGLQSLAETVITPLIEQAEGKIPININAPEWLEGRIASLIENI
ncbi:MAG: hypothetical protein QXT67_04840 [Candidatus Bathyarchaeia archaeon]